MDCSAAVRLSVPWASAEAIAFRAVVPIDGELSAGLVAAHRIRSAPADAASTQRRPTPPYASRAPAPIPSVIVTPANRSGLGARPGSPSTTSRPAGAGRAPDRPPTSPSRASRPPRSRSRRALRRPRGACHSETSQRDRPKIGVLRCGCRAKPGEVLGGCGHSRPLLGGDERGAERGDGPRVADVGALELVDEVPGLTEDVEHRGEVDVEAGAAQVPAGSDPGLTRPASTPWALSPICFSDRTGAPGRRRTSPPSWSVSISSGCARAARLGGSGARDHGAQLSGLEMFGAKKITPAASPARIAASSDAGGVRPAYA